MKKLTAHILIACLLAITLHGFGTDEHVFKTDISDSILLDEGAQQGNLDRDIESLGAACDICQVVHHYVVLGQDGTVVPRTRQALFAALLRGPPQFWADDILHPPTV